MSTLKSVNLMEGGANILDLVQHVMPVTSIQEESLLSLCSFFIRPNRVCASSMPCDELAGTCMASEK